MYATKYGEEFEGHLAQFVQAIWTLLTSTGLECKYDLLVSTALGFLGSVSERTGNGKLFSEGDALKTICEQVCFSNLQTDRFPSDSLANSPIPKRLIFDEIIFEITYEPKRSISTHLPK